MKMSQPPLQTAKIPSWIPFVLVPGAVLFLGFLYFNLNRDIDRLKSQINNSPPATVTSKATITKTITTLEQNIKSLPETSSTKKIKEELNRQLAGIQKQINTFPDNSIPLKDQFSLEKDLATARNTIWGTLFQAASGIFFIVTAYFTWQNVKIAQANLEETKNKQIMERSTAEANIKATEEKQITERFSKAVELLGK